MKIQKMYISGAQPSAPFLKEIQVMRADTFVTRLVGLMFRRALPPATGLLLAPCNSVHMCFMRFAIDVIYIDKGYNIIKVVNSLKPWIGLSMCGKAWAVLEMNAGEAERCGIAVGKRLLLKEQ